jgi:hypothetical protein
LALLVVIFVFHCFTSLRVCLRIQAGNIGTKLASHLIARGSVDTWAELISLVLKKLHCCLLLASFVFLVRCLAPLPSELSADFIRGDFEGRARHELHIVDPWTPEVPVPSAIYHEATMLGREGLPEVMENTDAVIHLAAWNPYPEASWEDCTSRTSL